MTYQTYLVGGAVRDELLQRPVTEKDWVVVAATPQQLLEQGYTQVGKDFPVFLHPTSKEEYALARTERKQGVGYTGFVCDASDSVTLEQDLLRRDLTINAMAKDDSGKIIDPYNGIDDLHNKVLRHVSAAFAEDPLRVLRVARFAARYDYLGFTIADETLCLMTQMSKSGELDSLPKERIWRETSKALEEKSPFVFFDVLNQCSALSHCFPTLSGIDHIADLGNAMQRLVSDSASSTRLTVPLHHGQCALISAGVARFSHVTGTDWLTQVGAPNAVVSVASTTVKIASAIEQTDMHPESIVELFNALDVWRKPNVFLSALQIVEYCPWFDAGIQVPHILAMLRHMLDIAFEVSAKDVLHPDLKGPQIKQAINEKRIEHIGAALKLW